MDCRPNILWICTDQQRYDTIGALGNDSVSTPVLNELVAGGMAFSRAYCQSPICTPSRASFLTGTYPSRVHVNGNGNEYFPAQPPLVSRILAEAGYDCGLIGKLHLASAYQRIEPRTEDGYRYWQYSHAPRDDWNSGHDYAEWVRSKGAMLSDLTCSKHGVPEELHQTTWCAEKAIDFMRQDRNGRPWLASVNIYDPHPPFNPPVRYRQMFDIEKMPQPLFREQDIAQQQALAVVDFQSVARFPDELDISSPVVTSSPLDTDWLATETPGSRDARTLKAAYYAMIRLIDDQVGRMLEELRESGQMDNTIVVFTSDHGEMLGDHGLIQKGCRFYEGLVRVPLIFSWPARIAAGRRSDVLVELVDMVPTLLDLTGLPVPSHIQGRSLVPLLGGADVPHRDFVRCEYYNALDLSDGTFATMYRDERYKLVVYHDHDLGELYDLVEDPEEFENMWDEDQAQPLKLRLMQASFDSSMLAMDRGPRRIGPM